MTALPISSMTESFDSALAGAGARRASGSASEAPNPEVVAVWPTGGSSDACAWSARFTRRVSRIG